MGGNDKPNNLPNNEKELEEQLEAITLESQKVERARKDTAEKNQASGSCIVCQK